MSRPTRLLTLALFVFASSAVFAGAAFAGEVPPEPLDVAGSWNLATTASLPAQRGGACEFEGTAQIAQDGTAISGDADLMLVEGPEGCPMEMSAQLSGIAADGRVEMGLLMGGNLGEASFAGSTGDVMGSLQGDFQTTSGPFAGSGGSWAAVRLGSVVPIPALGGWGLAVMACLLLAVGTVFMLRRRRLTAGG